MEIYFIYSFSITLSALSAQIQHPEHLKPIHTNLVLSGLN